MGLSENRGHLLDQNEQKQRSATDQGEGGGGREGKVDAAVRIAARRTYITLHYQPAFLFSPDSDAERIHHMLDKGQVLRRVKEHCLVGLRGTVRRATDPHMIHTNVDTDIIIAEVQSLCFQPKQAMKERKSLCALAQEPQPLGSSRKPDELYHIVENFSQGRRRLELFGTEHNRRPGWITVGREVETQVCRLFFPWPLADYFFF